MRKTITTKYNVFTREADGRIEYNANGFGKCQAAEMLLAVGYSTDEVAQIVFDGMGSVFAKRWATSVEKIVAEANSGTAAGDMQCQNLKKS